MPQRIEDNLPGYGPSQSEFVPGTAPAHRVPPDELYRRAKQASAISASLDLTPGPLTPVSDAIVRAGRFPNETRVVDRVTGADLGPSD